VPGRDFYWRERRAEKRVEDSLAEQGQVVGSWQRRRCHDHGALALVSNGIG
jgi:hypothetical protein